MIAPRRLLLAAALATLLAACSPVPTVVNAPASQTPARTVAPAGDIGSGPERLIGGMPPERGETPAMSARIEAQLVVDHCVDRDLAAPSAADPTLTILDRTYALPAEYVPPDLAAASEAGLGGTSGTKLVRRVLIGDLAAMAAAWEAAGLTIAIDSAYRSFTDQAATFDSWVARLGHAAALERTARPGHSEHQLGTAIDVSSPGWSGRFGDWALETAEGAWMAAHAWEYGFVMSYPADGRDATCFGYEPWHYRWIGREAAAAHRESGRDLRRFLARYSGG